MPPTLRQPALFAAPLSVRDEGAGRAVASRGRVACLLPMARQQTLWPASFWDSLYAPPHIPTRLPASMTAFRKQLRAQFKTHDWLADVWPSAPAAFIPYAAWVTDDLWRAWQAAERQALEGLIQSIGYTRALVDGDYRVFLEYRACDKTPHYRLLWRGVFFGRADIYIDANDSADVLASRSLPYVRRKLAAYLHALGVRPDTARLCPHTVPLDEDTDIDVLLAANEKTTTREHRIFKTNREKETSIPTRKRDIL